MRHDHQTVPDIEDDEFDGWAEERLARGEMSEEEFHEKYHEQIKAEFGVDERPTKPE